MDDLIKRTEVIKAVHEFFAEKVDEVYGDRDEVAAREIDFILKYNKELNGRIEKLQTAEARPVVYCKDCEHWGTGVAGETEQVKCCEYGKYMVGENGYCCYADMRKKV